MAIDLGYRPQERNRPEVTEFWQTRGKLLEFRTLVDKASPFLNRKQKEGLLEEWKRLWNGFHESGSDVNKDLEFHKRMWEPTENVASVIRENFMSFRGFLRTTFRWK
jgi:hypothetical protein